MLGINDLWLFVVSGLLLNMTPGADLLYLIDRSISQGVRYGVAAGLGASVGCIVHICIAVLGLSAVLATSEFAFSVVKYIGAAYLVYLGCSLLISKNKVVISTNNTSKKSGFFAVMGKAILINVLNPKVALFFLAFFPQFVDVSYDNLILAFLILGAIFIFNATLWSVFVAWSASSIAKKLSVNSTLGKAIKNLMAIIFFGFGVRLALSSMAG
ncbi:MAG: LysE family translocator [Gammaproteobacteria bacterium]|nr:LysE family translocator [Gammaproteobacteria bacterium]